ncbi:low molecular weight protein arginine phosphatase [Acutalibacter intestini]|uniref:low molecular weight protein arginine phosphatase n=1 Tax=Acutalibacter intestini TaxID=3093659 RepID=UPI002AC8BC33|nr:low molecular weight protein arginine phosphatase [Acutalibacter sp. M00204]
MNILFICTGNTCRSPMAAGLFQQMLEREGAGSLVACASAGIAAVEGQPASENAILACREAGVDLSAHRARRLAAEDLSRWDLFFTMSQTHGYILEQAGAPAQSIYAPGQIADPFGQGLEEYRRCRDHLKEELARFYAQVVRPRLAKEGGAWPCISGK